MSGFIISRVFQAIITLLILSVAVFFSVKLTGDPAIYMLGPDQGRMEYEQMVKQLGLDRPLIVQYWDFLTDILHADFGTSHFLERPARDLLLERFPATLQLAGMAFLLSLIIGVPLGVLSAVKRDTFVDTFGKFFATLGIATPNFWIAIMLIMLFCSILGWLFTYGRGGLDHLVLPAFVLGWSAMAGMVRLGRSSMLEVLDSEYVKFARIKGLTERLVIYKHALKNAIIPVLTFGGVSFAALLNGSIVIEVVFAWPGLGRLMLDSIRERDTNVILATILTAGFLYILLATIVDVLYAYVDPRIRYG